MSLSWIYLVLAGVFEIGWPLGFRLFGKSGQIAFLVLAVVSMGVSGYFLFLAQQKIPIGTAYAVWTGIGAIGTFLVGVVFFGDSTLLARWVGVFLILSGVITLKMTDTSHDAKPEETEAISVINDQSSSLPHPSDSVASKPPRRSEPSTS